MSTVRVSAEQFRRQLASLLNRSGYGGDQVIVERYGTPVAVLLPYRLYQTLITTPTSPVSVAEEVARDRLEASPADAYAPFEQVPTLAAKIEEAREAADLSYEVLARGLLTERMRTLREKYPAFAAEYASNEPA